MIVSDGNRIVYSYDGEMVWVEAWGNGLRVRATKGPECLMRTGPLARTGAGGDLPDGSGAQSVENLGRNRPQRQDHLTIRKTGLEEYVRNRKEYQFKPGVRPKSFASALIREAAGSNPF